MSWLTLGLVIALIAVLYAEFINGWTDAPNAIATVVSTGVMTPRNAVLMAVVLNTLGAMAGTAVAATVGKGIVESKFLTLPAITAAMIAIIVWGTFAAKVGLPISKSHALLAGLAGAGLAGGGFAALQCERLDQGVHRHVLRHSVRLRRLDPARQVDRAACRPDAAGRAPSACSIACRSPRPASWPSITASTMARSSWACSR